MSFTCTHCKNDDPAEVYVEHAKVSGVCTMCVDNRWIDCASCEALIGPGDERFEAETAEGIFCCEECADGADEAEADSRQFWREVASCNARGEAWA